MRLLSNRVYLNIGMEGYTDNVNGRSDRTLDRNILRGGLSYYTPQTYPNISFGMRLNNRENDGAVSIYLPPQGSIAEPVRVDNRVDDKMTNYNFTIDQSFRYYGFDNTAVFSMNTAKTDNALDSTVSTGTDLGTYSLSLTMRKGKLLESKLSYSTTSQTALGDIVDNGYNSLTLTTKYMVLPKQLWVTGAITRNSADGETVGLTQLPAGADSAAYPYSSVLKNSRTQLSLGADYNLKNKHKISFNMYKVFYSDDGYVEYYNGGQVMNSDSPYVRSRDDFVTRLRYTLKF